MFYIEEICLLSQVRELFFCFVGESRRIRNAEDCGESPVSVEDGRKMIYNGDGNNVYTEQKIITRTMITIMAIKSPHFKERIKRMVSVSSVC